MSQSAKFIKINSADNVAVCLHETKAFEEVVIAGESLIVQEDIPVGHKVALKCIPENSDVIKYGAPIGHATQNIEPGMHVHVQNFELFRSK